MKLNSSAGSPPSHHQVVEVVVEVVVVVVVVSPSHHQHAPPPLDQRDSGDHQQRLKPTRLLHGRPQQRKRLPTTHNLCKVEIIPIIVLINNGQVKEVLLFLMTYVGSDIILW